jgi:hypothetical protein
MCLFFRGELDDDLALPPPYVVAVIYIGESLRLDYRAVEKLLACGAVAASASG